MAAESASMTGCDNLAPAPGEYIVKSKGRPQRSSLFPHNSGLGHPAAVLCLGHHRKRVRRAVDLNLR